MSTPRSSRAMKAARLEGQFPQYEPAKPEAGRASSPIVFAIEGRSGIAVAPHPALCDGEHVVSLRGSDSALRVRPLLRGL